MLKNLRTVFLLLTMFVFTNNIYAQIKPGQMIDGIAAVIGDEIVLESDIAEQIAMAEQQGNKISNKCELVESIVNNKILIYEAKKDTLIENRSAAIKDQALQKYNQMASQFPDEKTMLAMYKFRTAFEMRTAIEKNDSDAYYGQAKFQRITENADVTPNEVTDFFTQFGHQLPQVNDEISLAKISLYPKLSDSHKQELIDRLNKIKKDIEGGESFESQARIYSEDEGSAANGGLYSNINRGQMVKPFEAAALNLQDGEMSEPIESDFGYHLIQLVKRNGKKYDARHILLKAEPNKDEINATKKELENIKAQIVAGKLTFKDAAFKHSDDKGTKFNAGMMTSQNGTDRIEKLHLDPTISYQVAGHNKGDVTDPFEETVNRRKAVSIVQIVDVIDAHQLDIQRDYERIKEMALNKKKNEIVEKWVKSKTPNIFISINDQYNSCEFKNNWEKK